MYSSRRVGYLIAVMLVCVKLWSYIVSYRLPNAITPICLGASHYPNSLRVLSYNVYLRPPMISHTHGDHKNERCALLSKILPLFDVVLLQEVHSCLNFRCNTLIQKAVEGGLPYHMCTYGPSIFSRHISNNGLLILSRYPIVATDYLVYKDYSGYDSIIEKGAIYANIRIGEKRSIHVFNTHLQSSYQPEDHGAADIRDRQLQQLREWVQTKEQGHSVGHTGESHIVCGGDFNISAKDLRESKSLYTHMHPLQDTLNHSKEPTITISYDYNTQQEDTSKCMVCRACQKEPTHTHILDAQRLDYIFHSPNLINDDSKILPLRISDTSFPFSQMSDHSALYTKFRWYNTES